MFPDVTVGWLRVASDVSATGGMLDNLWREVAGSGLWRANEVRRLIGGHPNLLGETMWKIVNAGDVEGCLGLAGCAGTPVDILGVLRESGSEAVRLEVIRNPCLPEWLLRKLPGDTGSVLVAVGACLRTYPEVLGELVRGGRGGSNLVRLTVAGNPNTPTRVLGELAAKGGGGMFLRTLICNPGLPVGAGRFLLPGLIGEGDGWVDVVPDRVLVGSLVEAGFVGSGVGLPREWLEQLAVSVFGDPVKV